MWYMLPTQKWIEDVVLKINEKQLDPENSRFMIAFFSSMDTNFVNYFKTNKKQISSFSGRNFHVFTPLIYDNETIPDDEWRYMRREFKSFGIPLESEPTVVFFSLHKGESINYEPCFFAGFTCESFGNFPKKLKKAIDISIETKDIHTLTQQLQEVFLSPNIIPEDNIDAEFKKTISANLPKAKIFISHSSTDKKFVKKLVKELVQDKSLNFWIDEQEIVVGDNIQISITQNLAVSDYLLLLISNNAIKSNWVQFEVSQFVAYKNGENILPILLEKGLSFPEPINNSLGSLKYLDFTDESKWEKNIDELKEKLQG